MTKKLKTDTVADKAVPAVVAAVVAPVAFAAGLAVKALKAALRSRALAGVKLDKAEATSADAVFALVTHPADVRELATSACKADDYALHTVGGTIEFLINRFDLKIGKRQLYRAASTGAVRAYMMANLTDAVGDLLKADDVRLPQRWDVGDRLSSEISTPNVLKNGVWQKRPNGAVAKAQIVKHVTKKDPAIAAELGKIAKTFGQDRLENPDGDEFAAAVKATKGPEREQKPERVADDCKARATAIMNKLARAVLAVKAADRETVLGNWSKTMAACFSKAAQKAALEAAIADAAKAAKA